MIVFTLYGGVYEHNIQVCITSDKKRARRYVQYRFDDLGYEPFVAPHEDPYGLFCEYKGCTPVIWLPRIPKTPREMGTLFHEVFHGVCAVMKWAGIPLSEASEEAYCHLIKHFTAQFFYQVNRAANRQRLKIVSATKSHPSKRAK